MKTKILIILILCFSCRCFAGKESEFEKMLSGFPHCGFENLYIDYDSKEPQNEYFIKRNMSPSKIENGAAFFPLQERFQNMSVDQIVISAGYGIVSIRFNAPIEIVEKKLSGFLVNGYNKSSRAGSETKVLTPFLEMDKSNIKKTLLYCDFEPQY